MIATPYPGSEGARPRQQGSCGHSNADIVNRLQLTVTESPAVARALETGNRRPRPQSNPAMWRPIASALIGAVATFGIGRAEPIGVRAAAERDRSDGPPAPWSLSDPLWRPALEPHDAQRDASALPLKLGAHTWAVIEGSWWSAEREAG